MWNDTEIDMEELEARLYGQVHHPTNGDEIPTSNPPVQEDLPSKMHKRYFDSNRMYQLPYNSRTTHHMYQRHRNYNRMYFQRGENFDSHQPALHYDDSTNFYERMGLFTLPEFVLNPAVNNIVVLPQPPTQIFAQNRPAEQEMLRRKRNKKKKRERKRIKEKLKKMEQNKKVFKEHHLTHKTVHLENKKDASKKSDTSKIEIICLSESDTSDCQIAETREPAIMISSDDEGDRKGLRQGDTVEIKLESSVKFSSSSSSNDNNTKQFELDGNVLISEPVEVDSGANKTENSDVQLDSVQPGKLGEDDDVVFVESGQNEVITISCDDSQSAVDAHSAVALISSQNDVPIILENDLCDRERTEILETPESTNDFLDSSFNSSQFSLDAVGGNNMSAQKSCLDVCESDSNFTVSDFDAPPRNVVFTEQEFDVPSKETFSELNLDSFTDYIGSKAFSSIPSILSLPKKSSSNVRKGNKCKNTTSNNSSDSSSESDYDNKVTVVESHRKTKQKINSVRLTSESDDCVVDGSCENEIQSARNKTSLPNLSPITSDEEANHTEKTTSNKNLKTKQKKKQRKATKNARLSGEKLKSVQELEGVTEIKKATRNKEEIHLDESKNEKQKGTNFFSSSDEFSEVEVVQFDTQSPHSSNTKFDIELPNIVNTSTPIKQPREEGRKPKRFSDYWTDDMRKFYTESWGDENFNVKEEQKTMSDDPLMWKIIDRDRIHTKLLPKGPRCHRCREFGHKFSNCNKKIGPPKCILCGASGHSDARCPNKMCTSCGRRSQYSTTYCSRCSNLRHLVCRICSRRGHTSSNCSDLWRRYHLTTKDGPLKQPSTFSLKSTKDRWCSGCASRGHFEVDCNYYNRTHLPTDLSVYSYEDVYEKRKSREQPDNFSRTENGNNYSNKNVAPSTQVSPWIFGYQPNAAYNQHSGRNFVQTYGTNQNFLQKFPVIQSVPNIFGLQQNLSNIFYPNSNLVSTSGTIPDTFVPSMSTYTSRGLPRGESYVGSNVASSSSRNLVAENVTEEIESELQRQTLPCDSNKYQRRDFLKLQDLSRQKLLNQEGVDFLRRFSKESNVKIKIIKRKKNKKISYWCMLEGLKGLLPKAKESIRNFCMPSDVSQFTAEPFDAMGTFNGKDFNMQVLQNNLAKLDNPNTNWLKVGNNLFYKIRRNWKKLSSSENSNEFDKIKEVEDTLKSQYVALNAVLLGKLDIEDGPKHMKVLKQAVQRGNLSDANEEALRESYNYIFRNFDKLNIAYKPMITSLPCHMNLKTEIDDLFKSGVSICKNNNMKEELGRLKCLYNSVIRCQYSRRKVDMFKKLHDSIIRNSAR